MDKQIVWLRELVEILQSNKGNISEMMEMLKVDLFDDEIFAFKDSISRNLYEMVGRVLADPKSFDRPLLYAEYENLYSDCERELIAADDEKIISI
mgnify:CR=1 FL=1